MPKRILPLSDLQISKAKAKDKDHALFDGGGLYRIAKAAKQYTTCGGDSTYAIIQTWEKAQSTLMHPAALPLMIC